MTPDARELAENFVQQFRRFLIAPNDTFALLVDCVEELIKQQRVSHGDAKIEEARFAAAKYIGTIGADVAVSIESEIRALKSAPLNPAEQETERE